MTIKLYDTYPYESEFQATVISCQQHPLGFDVVLDQTLFFPEEGGQNCDQGTINGIEVKDVQLIDGIIHHYLIAAVEGKITGKIDFLYRYSMMQNHSGEHILSGVVYRDYGYHNVGFHLGDHEITTDYDGFLNDDQLNALEKKANDIILQNKKIECYYPQSIEHLDYRCKKEITEEIRLVEIEDVDLCACCAPHVRSTIEVGVIKIIKAIRYKKGIRIYFLCGQRAVNDYMIKHEKSENISQALSAPVYRIDEYVDRLLMENQHLKQQLTALKHHIIDQKCQNLTLQHCQLVFTEELDRSLQQYYVNQLLKYSQKMAAVFVEEEKGYRFMIASPEDARVYLNKLSQCFEIKGGGKPDMVQGRILASQDEIKNVLTKIQ
ncbi:alanyl-tRNA editing protein [[Clostridium] spiroforme]|nr:alanyl-tRNA editing protein [Thomasclavelia spiroformis]MBM6880373.1 alanyl-tRNA editing protein [Thomasclavelia spiroformis]